MVNNKKLLYCRLLLIVLSMKNTHFISYKKIGIIICFLFSVGVYSQTQKQVQEIIKNYDLVKANQLLAKIKQREILEKKQVEVYAKNNNLPIFRVNSDGTFDQIMKLASDGNPVYYSIQNANAATSTRVNFLRSGGGLGLNLTGTGMVPRIWDGGPILATHQEFNGRTTFGDGLTVRNSNSFHAIHVTGTILASGVVAAAKGMAPTATARTFDWDNDESEATSEAMNGMLVSNHSYGVPVSSAPGAWYMGAYSNEAYNWDEIAQIFPYYLPIFSAGNDGTASNPSPSTSGYDKLNGNKTAKNVLTVANGQDATVDGTSGAIISGGAINTTSSQGPTDDGRIKPDVTGNGTGLYSTGNGSGTGGTNTSYVSLTGTSMAAPNVTGTLTLLQQHFFNINGKFMRAATLKGLACHTATDMGNVGPDAKFGWGYVNAKFAAETISGNGLTSWISEEVLNPGQTITMQVTATGGATPLLGSICWTDVADSSKINTGTLNESIPDLTNDLDIRITQGASVFYPWRLQSNASALATRSGDNNVDNVERITIDSPTAGAVYTITVSHKGTLSGGAQRFSLLVTGITSNFTFNSTADTQTKCSNTDDAVYNFSLTKLGGSNVAMTANNVPAGASLSFSQTNFTTSGNFTVTINNLASVAAGSYVIDIIGNNGTETEVKKIYLNVFHPTFTIPNLISPLDAETGLTTVASLTWQNDANVTSWDVEVSTSTTFSSLAFSGNVTQPTFQIIGLASNTIYYWRIKPKNNCANGSYSSVRSFTTSIIDCSIPAFVATDFTSATIADVANSTASVPVTVTGGLTIGKITANVAITHTYVQDMTILLTGPTSIGSPVIILQEEACGGQPDINCTYEDAGGVATCSTTSPAISGSIKSYELLHNVDSLLADGIWTLTVNDPYNGDGGSITAFSLAICSKGSALSTYVLNPDQQIAIYKSNQSIKIIADQPIHSVYLYDVLGRLVFQNDTITTTAFDIESVKPSNTVLFVKVVLDNQTIITKKIIF